MKPSYWVLSRYENFLIPCLAVWVTGSAIASSVPGFVLFRSACVLSVALILLGFMLILRTRWVIRTSFCVLCFLIGGLYFLRFSYQPPKDAFPIPLPQYHAFLQGVVKASSQNKLLIETSTINRQSAHVMIQAKLPDLEAEKPEIQMPEIGSRIQVEGMLLPPQSALFPGGFDQRKYLYSQQIAAVLTRCRNLAILETEPKTWETVFLRHSGRIRKRILSAFHRYYGSPDGDVYAGMVLGDQVIPIEPGTKQAFINTGLVHLLAASGMNVAMIAGFILWLPSLGLPFLRRYKLVRNVFTMVLVAVYAVLAGFSPSIVRAALMLEMALLIKCLDRNLSGLFLLCAAAWLMAVFWPDTVASVSFQFSVLTTFGILAMGPTLRKWLGYYITHWLSDMIVLPVVAQLWILPISLYYFNQLPLHALPLNIVAVPLTAPLTIIGFLSAALSLVYVQLGAWVSLAGWPFLKLLMILVYWGDSWRWAEWTLPSPAPALLLTAYFILGLAAAFCKGFQRIAVRIKVGALLAMILLTAAIFSCQAVFIQPEAVVHYLPLHRHALWLTQEFSPGKTTPKATRPKTILWIEKAPTPFEGMQLLSFMRHLDIQTVEKHSLNMTVSRPDILQTNALCLFPSMPVCSLVLSPIRLSAKRVRFVLQLGPHQTLMPPLGYHQVRLWPDRIEIY